MEKEIKVRQLRSIKDQLQRSLDSLKEIENGNYTTDWGKAMLEGLSIGIRWYETDIKLIEKTIEIYEL